MNRRFLLAALALLVLAAILYAGPGLEEGPGDVPPRTPPDRDEIARSPRESTAVSGERDSPKTRSEASVADREAVLQTEKRVQALEETLDAAEERLRAARRALAASEAEVTELEAMIADIKARGEDPADYGDLAMERFRPAFFRYQDAQAAFDSAERLRAETRAALDAARAELARSRSSGAM